MTVYADGEAPWSEDEQFRERAKACKSRTKQFGECDGEGDFDGQCDGCIDQATEKLLARYKTSAQPTTAISSNHPTTAKE